MHGAVSRKKAAGTFRLQTAVCVASKPCLCGFLTFWVGSMHACTLLFFTAPLQCLSARARERESKPWVGEFICRL